jgi:hypothetical protein
MLPKKYQRWENAAHWFMGSVFALWFVWAVLIVVIQITSVWWWVAALPIWFPTCSVLLYVPGWFYQRKMKRLEQPKK